LSKNEIIAGLHASNTELLHFCQSLSDELFFRQPSQKWSIAQNVIHLRISAKATQLAYGAPKLFLRMYTGKPNRPSRGYEELVRRYQQRLAAGGKATGRFIPPVVTPGETKQALLQSYKMSMQRLLTLIERKWKDSQLDFYLAPHPLLGKLTLRELAFFTIYHTEHHLAIMRLRSME
jgi:hypothetical protein